MAVAGVQGLENPRAIRLRVHSDGNSRVALLYFFADFRLGMGCSGCRRNAHILERSSGHSVFRYLPLDNAWFEKDMGKASQKKAQSHGADSVGQ